MKNIKDVNAAFDILIEQLQLSIKELKNQMNKLIDNGEFENFERISDKLKEAGIFLTEIKNFQEKWNKIFSKGFHKRGSNKNVRAKKGQKTPEDKFKIPILQSVVELGGKGKVKDVLEKVYQKMKDIFTELDYEPLSSNSKSIRWKNTAQWCRMKMVNEGLLSKNSPNGIWEITEKGKEYLKQNLK